MFVVVFRLLFLVGFIFIVCLVAYRQIRKIELTEARREKLREAIINIEETLAEAKSISAPDKKKLKKAREKIGELLGEGEENG